MCKRRQLTSLVEEKKCHWRRSGSELAPRVKNYIFVHVLQAPWQLRNVIPPSPGFSSPTRCQFLSIRCESFARFRTALTACCSSTITGICSRLATEKFSSEQLHHVLRYWRNFQTTVSMMRIRATPKTPGNGITNDSGTVPENYINKPIKHVRQTVYRAASLLVARCCGCEKCFTWIFQAYAVLRCCCCRWWQASFSTSHSRTSRVMIYSIFEYVFVFSLLHHILVIWCARLECWGTRRGLTRLSSF